MLKHGEDAGHLVEVVLGLTETLLQFDAVKNQRDLHPLGVPVCAIRRGGYVRILNILLTRSRHIQASRLSDAISPDSVHFRVNLAEYCGKSV
ncbi:hypothetical protein C468_00075 [Halorubrum kocurii JCM 14978]|uniref:Uncharacterized protein n=1 Tax=Halorubrum kocurii JCM 14978 TaxID=1230456 RepID=M0PKA8_9EURY|nr:hypothetical protein C468_00075 [Halorubrum kocurii JCM 14978]